MMPIVKRALGPAIIALVATCGTAFAAPAPTGLWYDHTGRGAVEITECGGNLCGRLVWVKEAGHKEGCGLQIFANVKPVAGGKWDGGWIIDPEKDLNTKYDVEITPQGDKLKVMGYAGTKFLNQTMIWTRAPATLPRCDLSAQAPSGKAPPVSARSNEPSTVAPPAAPAPASPRMVERSAPPAPTPTTPRVVEREAPAPAPAAKSGRDCKIEFGGITLSFPCGD
jgi:uncharacterized protein (DUF2147 family)